MTCSYDLILVIGNTTYVGNTREETLEKQRKQENNKTLNSTDDRITINGYMACQNVRWQHLPVGVHVWWELKGLEFNL